MGRRTFLCGSDWRCAVADLHVKFLRRLGLRRLLQHVMLHDHLLIGVDGRVRVIRVVAWLVAARLIRWLGGQWLFALAAQQLAAEAKSEEETFQANRKWWHKEQKFSKINQCLSLELPRIGRRCHQVGVCATLWHSLYTIQIPNMCRLKRKTNRCRPVNQSLFLKPKNLCMRRSIGAQNSSARPLIVETRQFLPQVGCVWQVPVDSLCVLWWEAYSRFYVTLL